MPSSEKIKLKISIYKSLLKSNLEPFRTVFKKKSTEALTILKVSFVLLLKTT